ncbi:hypothetical protein BsWGS_19040 [Bradybaena similaris]
MSEDRNKEPDPIALPEAGAEDAEPDLRPRTNPVEVVSVTEAGPNEAQGSIKVYFTVFHPDGNMTPHETYCDLDSSIEGLKIECAQLFGARRYRQEWRCDKNKDNPLDDQETLLEDDKTLLHYEIDGIHKGAIIRVDLKN